MPSPATALGPIAPPHGRSGGPTCGAVLLAGGQLLGVKPDTDTCVEVPAGRPQPEPDSSPRRRERQNHDCSFDPGRHRGTEPFSIFAEFCSVLGHASALGARVAATVGVAGGLMVTGSALSAPGRAGARDVRVRPRRGGPGHISAVVSCEGVPDRHPAQGKPVPQPEQDPSAAVERPGRFTCGRRLLRRQDPSCGQEVPALQGPAGRRGGRACTRQALGLSAFRVEGPTTVDLQAPGGLVLLDGR